MFGDQGKKDWDGKKNSGDEKRGYDKRETKFNAFEKEIWGAVKAGKLSKEDAMKKLEGLKKALGEDDVEAIGSATEALMVTSQEFGQRLYEAAQAESDAAGASGSAAGSDDDVVDAEIVDES